MEEGRPGCLRGFFRLSLSLLIFLFFLVALMPTLLSLDGGRKWVLKKVNAAVAPAQVSCEKWSLGWFRAPMLQKAGYVDVARGIDFKVSEVAFDRGLLRLLPLGILNVGSVTLRHPDVQVSLVPPAEAPQTEKGGKAAQKGFFFLPIVDVAAVLAVENGRVQVPDPASGPFFAQQIEGTVTLASYKKPIAVQTKMKVGTGLLALEGNVLSIKDIYKGTDLEQPEKLTLKLVAVDLTAFCPLIRHAAGEPWIYSGVADGALTAVIKGQDQFKIEGGVLVNGLSVSGAGQPRSPKGDVALLLDLDYDKTVIKVAKFDFSSPWARAEANGTLRTGAKTRVMTGTINAKASVHLAALTRDFASVLGLAKGFRMQTGELNATFALEGGDKAMRVDVQANTADLAMTVDGAPLPLKPEPSLVFKATFPYGAWPEVETFHLKAPFADVYGRGRFDAAVVKGKLDLTRFSRDFKLVLKDCPPMVGSTYLDIATKRVNGGVDVTSFLKLADVAAEIKPGQRTVVSQGTLKFTGHVPFKEDKPERAVQDGVFELTLENGKVTGGWKRFVPPDESTKLSLRGFTLSGDMEMGGVRRVLGGFIPASAQRRMVSWQGHAVANATAEVSGGVTKVRMNAAGQKLVSKGADGTWSVPDIRLEGALTQDGVREDVRVGVKASGCGMLVRDGETVFAEKSVTVEADAVVASDGQRIRFSKANVTSDFFDLESVAEVTEPSTRCVVSAKGRTALDFDAVSRLLEAEGIDEFVMKGKALRAFRFVSPTTGGLSTILSEGEFEGAAYMESVNGLGLTAGPADATFNLSKGVLKVSYAPILNGGKLRLVPAAVVGGKDVSLAFPAKTRLLENVTLTQGMVDTLLVNLNPLFQGSTVLGGTVTLELRNSRIDMGAVPAEGIAVDMDVTLKQLKLEMGPSLLELLSMIKVKERVYEVDQLPIHVVVKDGRVLNDPVRMVIDKQPVIFSGWVAFDGTVKYLIEVPVTERLTGGGTAGKMLKGTVIKIPVSGTVHSPKLDARALQNMLGNMLKSAVGEHAVEKVGSFLEKLQQELQK